MLSLNDAIIALLSEGPKPRAFIEAVMCHDLSFDAKDVTARLRTLRDLGAIQHMRLAIESSNLGADVYSLTPLTSEEAREITALLVQRDSALDREALRRAGEGYVRSLIIRSGRFNSVTPRKKLGVVNIPDSHLTADLTFRYRNGPPFDTLIVAEIKNAREVYYPASTIFPTLLEKAVRLDAQPVLIAAHLSDDAKRFCAQVGIGSLELRRQLIPKRLKKAILSASVIAGPMPYEAIAERFYQNERTLPLDAQRDLQAVSSVDWLADAHVAWSQAKPIVKHYITAPWIIARPSIRIALRRLDIKSLTGPSEKVLESLKRLEPQAGQGG